MVLEAGFSGATTEDIWPTGTLSVSMEGGTGFWMPVVVVQGRWMQLKEGSLALSEKTHKMKLMKFPFFFGLSVV